MQSASTRTNWTVFLLDPTQRFVRSQAKQRGVSVDEVAKQRAAAVPAKRIGQPDEFGATCAFLCSAHAGYITGQALSVSGGLVMN